MTFILDSLELGRMTVGGWTVNREHANGQGETGQGIRKIEYLQYRYAEIPINKFTSKVHHPYIFQWTHRLSPSIKTDLTS